MTQTRSGKGATAGDKHKLDGNESLPPSKAQKQDEQGEKKQLTLDESLNGNTKKEENSQEAVETEANPEENEGGDSKAQPEETEGQTNDRDEQTESKEGDIKDQTEEKDTKGQTKEEDDQDTAVEPHGRNGATPSTILEKGIIYFFFRGRVGIDHPEKVDDIARSYMVLRPIPTDAKLGDGPIGDVGNSRLIAIPKKVLPRSGSDRWLAFVEKTDASFGKLKDEFLAANDYETKTAGTRHSPAATPFGEGVYAITTTGRESHLAYILTLPEKLGKVQTEIGLQEKGSWILSTRNPQYPAPQNAALPEGPDFSQEILDEFRSLRWMGTLPKHLVPNAQFLLVGEPSGIEKAMQQDEKDEKDDGKSKPMEEMQKLEDEDTDRMEHLGKDSSAAIFMDLEASAKGYPKLQTTF